MNELEFLKLTNAIDPELAAEYCTAEPKKRHSAKRAVRIAVIAAAVLALMIPAATYAYNTFVHKETVEMFLDNADALDKYAVNHTMENEHLRRTVDLLLSDGHNVMTVETQEYKDELGEKFVRNIIQGYYLMTYADGAEGPYSEDDYYPKYPRVGSASTLGITKTTADIKYERISSIYSCKGIDLDKELRIIFYASRDGFADAEQYFRKRFPELNWYFSGQGTGAENLLEGFEYVTSFAPNVECVPLHSEDGVTIFMSQFEVFAEGEGAHKAIHPSQFAQYSFILKNGEKRPFLKNVDVGGEDYQTFGEVIDLEDYAGIEIGGIKYLK